MTSFVLTQWDYARNADRRFQRIVNTLVLIYIIVGVIIPFIHLIGLEQGGGDNGQMRYAQLIEQRKVPVAVKQEEPAPAPENKPEPEPPKPQKQTTPKPTPVPPPPSPQMQIEHARAIAQRSGLLAMSKDFSDLRNQTLSTPDSALRQSVSPSAGGGGVSSSDAAAFSASAGSASGGITTTTPGSASHRASGTSLGQRRTTTVQSPIGFGRDKTKQGQNGDKLMAGRTLEEIQLTFDRSKSAFYSIFNRAMRETPNMGAGKIIVSLTIAPDGSVTDCKLVSSTFGDAGLESKVVERVKLLNFGAKDVPSFTYPNYPINFLPS
ncbi:MAG: AgmX/PglI C-terminal domain-containing protein [Stenotrophobium sp.]